MDDISRENKQVDNGRQKNEESTLVENAAESASMKNEAEVILNISHKEHNQILGRNKIYKLSNTYTLLIFLEGKEKPDECVDDFKRLLDMNREIINTLKINDLINENKNELPVEKHSNKEHAVNFIKPYTVSQLSALYHNNELEILETYNAQFAEAELKGR